MNGPLKMYLTKQIIRHDVPVELPNCMYKLKNIHSVRNGTVIKEADHVSVANKNLDTFDEVIEFLKNQKQPEMAALVVRQEKILRQLADLKEQMLSLKETLRVDTSTTSSSAANECTVKISNHVEVVINASPTHPPYCLQALQKLWASTVTLKVKFHLHSTVSSLPENVRTFAEQLESYKPVSNQLPEIIVRIIWKDVGSQTELIVSNVPILGEVNILRYLARISSGLNYESGDALELDSVLDTCYLLVRSRTKTERMAMLQSLNKKLGKSQWFCGRNEFTIADIAAYSSLKQISSNEINVNMTKWLQKCETCFS